jgi:hypothetical protein
MIEFLHLPEDRRRQYIRQVSIETGMSEKAVEKDWWVTLVLKAVFALPMSQHFVFKGGTSLSKGWKLVERLSEDIDIALAPEAFGKGYKSEPSHSYVKQLKKDGASFTSSVIADELYTQLKRMGVPEKLFSVSVEMIPRKLPDKDPQTVFVRYISLYEANTYVADEVKVEFGVRSLKEPFDEVSILSTIGTHIRVASYSEQPFVVRAVLPEKTMIEKLLLLHEKFSREGLKELLIAERQSRHLADLVRLKSREIHHRILSDPALFQAILKHREAYIRLRGVDYGNMTLQTLQFIPPASIREQFHRDYDLMRAQMIYGDSPDFGTIINELEQLAETFRTSAV